MIQVVAWHYLSILYFLTYPKSDLGEVEKALLQFVAGPSYTFSHSGRPKIGHWLGRENDDSSGYLPLPRHINLYGLSKMRRRRGRELCCTRSPVPEHTFSTSGSLKIRINRGRESEDSRCCLSIFRHFIHSGLCKMRLGRVRGNIFTSGRWALRTKFRRLAIEKYDFREVEKPMIQEVSLHYVGIL